MDVAGDRKPTSFCLWNCPGPKEVEIFSDLLGSLILQDVFFGDVFICGGAKVSLTHRCTRRPLSSSPLFPPHRFYPDILSCLFPQPPSPRAPPFPSPRAPCEIRSLSALHTVPSMYAYPVLPVSSHPNTPLLVPLLLHARAEQHADGHVRRAPVTAHPRT